MAAKKALQQQTNNSNDKLDQVSQSTIFARLGGTPPVVLPFGGGGPGSLSSSAARGVLSTTSSGSAAVNSSFSYTPTSSPFIGEYPSASSEQQQQQQGVGIGGSTHHQPLTRLEGALAAATSTLLLTHDRNIVDTVTRDVVQRDLGVSFNDIAALSTAKRLLSEAVVLPLMVPEFFTGIREPWKGVLLFGPPGTGE